MHLLKHSFIDFFLTVLGLRCCVSFFSSCGERGYSSRSVQTSHYSGFRARGLSSWGSRALEHRLSGCGSRAELLHGMCDLPDQGLNLSLLRWQADSLPPSTREALYASLFIPTTLSVFSPDHCISTTASPLVPPNFNSGSDQF